MRSSGRESVDTKPGEKDPKFSPWKSTEENTLKFPASLPVTSTAIKPLGVFKQEKIKPESNPSSRTEESDTNSTVSEEVRGMQTARRRESSEQVFDEDDYIKLNKSPSDLRTYVAGNG